MIRNKKLPLCIRICAYNMYEGNTTSAYKHKYKQAYKKHLYETFCIKTIDNILKSCDSCIRTADYVNETFNIILDITLVHLYFYHRCTFVFIYTCEL